MKNCHLALEVRYRVVPNRSVTLTCELSYDVQDPLAVGLVLNVGGVRPVRWVFARELLADGIVARAGEGDVAVWPLHDEGEGIADEGAFFCVRVGGVRTARFEFPVEPVADWLADTYELVPWGTELHGVDWNQLLEPAE